MQGTRATHRTQHKVHHAAATSRLEHAPSQRDQPQTAIFIFIREKEAAGVKRLSSLLAQNRTSMKEAELAPETMRKRYIHPT